MSHQQLRERLRKGFYVRNLYEMAHLCRSLALDVSNPVPFFVIEQIFLDIARHWEDKPLPVEEAKLVESRLLKPVEDLVKGMGADASSEEIFNLVNRVVSAYLVLRDSL